MKIDYVDEEFVLNELFKVKILFGNEHITLEVVDSILYIKYKDYSFEFTDNKVWDYLNSEYIKIDKLPL